MSKVPSYIMQGDNLVMVIDNMSHNVSRDSHSNYQKILDAIRDGDWDQVKSLVDMGKTMTNYAQGKLSIVNGDLFWEGRAFHNAMAKRTIQMYESGFNIEPMVAFMTNLMENPSYRSVEELYGFLEKNELPITPDGCFMAYKRVKEKGSGNFVDAYTGKISNNVGDTVTMTRNEVNDDPNQTCSAGLHFCSLSYLSSSGYARDGVIVLVKINPKDVVSIPSDYNNQKGRCCAYTVEAIHGTNDREEAFDDVVVSYNDNDVSEKFECTDDVEEQRYHVNLDKDDGDSSDMYKYI